MILSVHPLSIPPLMMAGIVFYVGLSHLLLSRRRDQRVLDLTFAVTCLGMGLYNLFCAGLYSATEPCEGAVFQQAQLASLAFTSIFFLWFVAEYTGLISRATCLLFGFYFAFATVADVVGGSLVFRTNAPSIKHVAFPVLGNITYFEVSPGALIHFQNLVGLAAIAVALAASYRLWRRCPDRRSRRILQALIIFAIGSANDAAVGSGIHETIYLIEYCFLAMVLVMTSSMTREVAETEVTRALLDEMQKRFRAVFQTVSVGMGMSDLNGVLFEANAALAAMFGRHVNEVVGCSLFESIHSEDAPRMRECVTDLLVGDIASYRDEVRYVHPDGGEYWGDIAAGVIRDQTGDAQALSWILIGITERRKAVSSLTRMNEELEDRIAERTMALTEMNRRLGDMLRELEEGERAAQMIQFNLLPAPSCTLSRVSFQYFLQPSETMSGDFLDYFEVGHGHVVFYMADVSGHGVSSSFVTVLLKSFMRSLRDQHTNTGDTTLLKPRVILDRLNRQLRGQDVGKHVTILYGVLDIELNVLELATGGHFPHPVLLQDGKSEVLPLKGAAIGLFDTTAFNCISMKLPPEFTLAVFSDGILDVLPQQHLQDKQTYLASLLTGETMDPAEVAKKVGVDPAHPAPDDVTILIVRREGNHDRG